MLKTQFYLSIQGRNITLTYGTQLTQSDISELQPQNYDNIVAQVNPNPKNPEILGLKNCSTQVWTTTLPSGDTRQIQTGQTVKLENNTQIIFGLVNGVITSQDVSYQVVSNKNEYKSQNKKNQGTPILVIIGSIIAATIFLSLVSYSPLFISFFLNTRTDNSSKEKITSTENLVTKLSDTKKTWQGYFESKPATLSLDFYVVLEDSNLANVTGKLTVSDKKTDSYIIINFNGKIDAKTQTISFQETEYLANPPDYKWALGTNQGRIDADSFSISGEGRDTNSSYSWCFDYIDAVKKTCTNEQTNNTPSPEPTSSPDSTAPELSESKAAILINQWLQAKQRIFGSSHDKYLIAENFTGKAHEKVQNNVNKIEQNQEYYIFEKQEVKRIDNFSETVSNEVIIDVTLNEIYKLYNNQGKVDTQENSQENSEYYGIMRVHLVYSKNQWKIADFYNIKELQHPKYD